MVQSLKKEVDEAKLQTSSNDEKQGPGLRTTNQFQTMTRSAAVPVTDTRAIVSAPAAAPTVAPSVPPVVSTPPAQQTSAEIFADTLISTPTTSTHTGAASQRTSPPGAAGDRTQSDI
jgi:hypothetical protein